MTIEPHRLADIVEIHQLFAARLRALDMKDWDLYAACHTGDVRGQTYGDHPGATTPDENAPVYDYVGIPGMIARIRDFIEGPVPLITCHHGHNPEITLLSETEASGIWAMEDRLWWSDGERREMMHGHGHYHETYRKVDGRWLISFRKLTRLHLERSPGFYDRPGA